MIKSHSGNAGLQKGIRKLLTFHKSAFEFKNFKQVMSIRI